MSTHTPTGVQTTTIIAHKPRKEPCMFNHDGDNPTAKDCRFGSGCRSRNRTPATGVKKWEIEPKSCKKIHSEDDKDNGKRDVCPYGNKCRYYNGMHTKEWKVEMQKHFASNSTDVSRDNSVAVKNRYNSGVFDIEALVKQLPASFSEVELKHSDGTTITIKQNSVTTTTQTVTTELLSGEKVTGVSTTTNVVGDNAAMSTINRLLQRLYQPWK